MKAYKFAEHVLRGKKVLAAVSGGKDSAFAAYVAKKVGADVLLFHINLGIPGFSEASLEAVRELAEFLDVPLEILDLKKEFGWSIPEIAKKGYKPCAVCGLLKRYYQNRKALETKRVLVTGHNIDDMAAFAIYNVITGNFSYLSSLYPDIPAIGPLARKVRPLFYDEEKVIIEEVKRLGLPYTDAACPFKTTAPTLHIKDGLEIISEKIPRFKELLVKNLRRFGGERSVPNKCRICGGPAKGDICAVCRLKTELKKRCGGGDSNP